MVNFERWSCQRVAPAIHNSTIKIYNASMRIESVKRLLVRGPNWVGDAIMGEPALSALRGLFPTAEITLLVKPTIAELLGNHPGLDRMLVYDRRRRLVQAGIGETDLVVGLNPGSTYGTAKRWLPDRFAETADRLVREHGGKGLRVVIVGARGEEALGRAIAERMQAKPVLLSGQTSIRELMAVIRRCGLFVTNDTGPMHIAAAFGIPVVAVFGPTDSRTTAPTGDGHTIVRHPVECSPCLLRECPIDHRCMTRISVDEVFAAAKKQLAGISGLSALSGSPDLEQTNQTHETNQPTRLDGVTVFLDRNGTLNRDTGYVKTPEELELFPGVIEAVARLNQAGARVVLTTNQSGVARGLITTAALDAIHARLRALLEAGGASLDAIYYCPHHPDDACSCRKPRPGLG